LPPRASVMESKIEQLLAAPPFSPRAEKEPLFLEAMHEAVSFHQTHCPFYGGFLSANHFRGRLGALQDLPPLPVSIFKERTLVSVPEADIVKVTHSSATSSGTPSTIMIDAVTRDRQRRALSQIMVSLLGEERRPFIIVDNRETLFPAGGELSSRATTIRGLLSFSSGFFCILNPDFSLNTDLLGAALKRCGSRPAVFFGVTTVLYEVWKRYKDDISVKGIFGEFLSPSVLLSGGWKKLASLEVGQEEFKNGLARFFSTDRNRIIDFYGMIEQPGVIYPECEHGYKHVPTCGEVLIRDTKTMESLSAGNEGMIEVVCPLAHSYPGIALLTDDVGKLEGYDDCACGRGGAYFSFVRRAPQAEAKGCADTLMMPE